MLNSNTRLYQPLVFIVPYINKKGKELFLPFKFGLTDVYLQSSGIFQPLLTVAVSGYEAASLCKTNSLFPPARIYELSERTSSKRT